MDSVHDMKFFFKDISITMQTRMVIFGIQVDDNFSYRGIEHQPVPAYSSQYLSNFLSLLI